MVLSLDANALYPSPNIEKTSRIVAKKVVFSNIKIDEVDYTWASKYVVLNLDRSEITVSSLED